MNLNIFIVLLSTLFTGGHSLKCYNCTSTSGSCVGVEATCATNSTTCASATMVSTAGYSSVTSKHKSCYFPEYCASGSVNIGLLRITVSMQCCNTDLCNSQDVPDSNSNSPNGKQCYSCEGTSCSNKLNCLGTEDNCITAQANMTSLPTTLKGCISKSLCTAASQATQGLVDFSCCPGNLCNSAMSITHNLLFFLLPFICYIMF